jgi:hypothetical protein
MSKILASVAITAALTLFTPLFVTASASEMTCHIPFSFSVHGRTLPPGFYTLYTRDAMLLVRGPKNAAVALTSPIESRDQTGVAAVFLKTGENYELIEAWTGNGAGRQVLRSDGSRKDKARAANAPIERIVIAGM